MSWTDDLDGNHIIAHPYNELHKDLDRLRKTLGEIETKEYPAWSLTALLEIMPFTIDIDNEEFYYLSAGRGRESYCIDYSNVNNGSLICQFIDKSFIDAAYNAVVWLLEQGYIKNK